MDILNAEQLLVQSDASVNIIKTCFKSVIHNFKTLLFSLGGYIGSNFTLTHPLTHPLTHSLKSMCGTGVAALFAAFIVINGSIVVRSSFPCLRCSLHRNTMCVVPVAW